MIITVRLQGQGHIRFRRAVRMLGEGKAKKAFTRALNHTGAIVRTRVIRALAPQVGLSQAKVRQLGAIREQRARASGLEYKIESSGAAISLREFSARQFGYGVAAKPWGQRRRFESAFIFAGHPRSGNPVSGGHVFVRTSSSSFPIKKMFGPAIPKEMVKDESAEAFSDAAARLSPRINHEIRRLTRGVIS